MSRLFIQGLGYLFWPLFAKFETALKQPQFAQDKLKHQVIKQLAKTTYGQSLGINNNSHWQQVPLVTYDELEPWLSQQRQLINQPILSPEKILFWQQTSGSSGNKKLIPYTPTLIRIFSVMFCLWASDLLRHGPRFESAKSYLCLSPNLGSATAGIDDTIYVSPLLRGLIKPLLVTTQTHYPDADSFRWDLALALLTEPQLEIISLWNPTFLTVQLEFIQQHRQALLDKIGDRLSADRQILLRESVINWQQLWPQLKLISCWDSLFAAEPAQRLKQYFPDVYIQGKGLLATEAPVTIPLINARGFVPLVNQLVLEFIAPDHQILNLHQLKTDTIYELVISHLGGLYRYRLGDRLKVSHWYHNTPCLELLGRGDRTSDLVGEKLTEEFVRQVFNALGLKDQEFCYLVPLKNSHPHYCLYLDHIPGLDQQFCQQLETSLQQNYHYQLARQLKQLAPVQIRSGLMPQWLAQRLKKSRLGDQKNYCLQLPPSPLMEKDWDLIRPTL